MTKISIILLIFSTLSVNAQFIQQANIYPANITAGDEFGVSADIDGNFIAIGAYYYSDASSSPGYGSVYLWNYNGTSWNYNSQIIPSDNPHNGDQFGNAVALSGNNMIIGSWNGSPDGDLNPGYIYFYNYDGTDWSSETKLGCGITNQYDLGFGTSVDIYGDYAVTGAPGISSNTGRIFIYYKNSGTWELKTTIDGQSTEDYFGSSVAIGDGIIFVGATGENSVYVFEGSDATWVQTNVLTVSGTVSFGNSLSYDGINLAIGDEGGNKAYIFNYNGTNWIHQTIIGSDIGSTDHYGCDVSISNNHVIVGSWAKNSMTGAAYIFENNSGTWTQNQKVTASNGGANDRFGKSVALNNYDLVIGAFYDNPGSGAEAGSAYIFQSAPPPIPAITSQPQNTSVCEGSTASFNITATDVISYQWYNTSGALSNGGDISGVTSNQLNIANTEQADEDNYYCIVSNGNGDTQSNNASLTVDQFIYAPAGNDDNSYDGTYTLNAETPTQGTGEWSVISGCGTFNDINDPVTIISDLCESDNTLRWEITNGQCITYDDVTITYEPEGISQQKRLLFNIFPNPGNGKFILSNINNEKIKTINIYDVTGKNILNLSKNLNANIEIDITKNKNGIYIISLQTESNIYKFKFVKK